MKNTKLRTNVSLDSELLEAARLQKLVLSTLLEQAIRLELARRAESAWKVENQAAIEAWNREVDAHGVFSDGLRSF
ncbi:MAG: type II toxin-antitoxin system CcdA family antitoxin [Spirochaetales bacterium]